MPIFQLPEFIFRWSFALELRSESSLKMLVCYSESFASCHSEPFPCHSEGAKRPKNLVQDRLREESRPFTSFRVTELIFSGEIIRNMILDFWE